VLLGVGFFYYILSLGPTAFLAGEKIIDLPYFSWLASIPPFIISRTPARYGIVFVGLSMILAFKHGYVYAEKKGWLTKHRWLGLGLFLYAWLWVFGISGVIRPPYMDLEEMIPWRALEVMRNDERKIAVHHIPVTIRGDGMPTFLQAYHRKPVTFAYVSYSVLDPGLMQSLWQEPAMYGLECEDDMLGVKSPYGTGNRLSAVETRQQDERFQDGQQFVQMLKDYQVGYVVIYKEIINQKRCADLINWTENVMFNFEELALVEDTPQMLVIKVK